MPPCSLDEARRLARVRHPHVVAIHGIETIDGRLGMWTELVDGPTLETVLSAQGPMSEPEIVQIGAAILGALAAVHRAGLIHADVKAANVMIDRDGRPILMDFGAGREGAAVGRAGATAASGVVRPAFGTPLVMAPELLHGAEPTIASDLYAAGVLLYRLATGRYPVEATTRRELLQKLSQERIPPLSEARPELSTFLCDAIMDSLRPDPRTRPASATAMAARLYIDEAAGPDDLLHPPAKTRVLKNAPVFETRFVGRNDLLRALERALRPGTWITLTGPGGSGKTRLAHELAGRSIDGYFEHGYWIDLSGIAHADEFELEVARVLDIPLGASPSPLHDVSGRIAGARLLLILDNLEHLAATVLPRIRRLRRDCPGLALLVTSRVRLGDGSEQAVAVPPLPLPPETVCSPAEALESDALRLFAIRARTVRPSFHLAPSNVAAIAAICRRVDGIPLAIELAAARIGTMGETELSARLEQSLSLLQDRKGDRRPQHATIHALVDWSTALLSPAAYELFLRLSVFAPTFSLDAVEAVCADPDAESGVGVDPPHEGEAPPTPKSAEVRDRSRSTIRKDDVADLLTEIVEQSLLAFDPGKRPRYRMLTLVQERARAVAHTPGPARSEDRTLALAWRHHRWCHELAREAAAQLGGSDPEPALALLDVERENLRRALAQPAVTPDQVRCRLELLLTLGKWWWIRGRFHEGARELARARDLPEHDELAGLRNDVGLLLAKLLIGLGRSGEAREELERCIDAIDARGDPRELGAPLANLGAVHIEAGDLDRARDCLDRARAVFQTRGDSHELAVVLGNLGVTAERAGDDVTAN
ncbi:MAG: protein kinase, partial [Candidatus Eisenbacteria bacterium]